MSRLAIPAVLAVALTSPQIDEIIKQFSSLVHVAEVFAGVASSLIGILLLNRQRRNRVEHSHVLNSIKDQLSRLPK